MKEIISQKNVLVLFMAIAVFGLVFGMFRYYENNRNKETIVDLGNGWKSYLHEDFGITVKIPSDAELESRVIGDKKNVSMMLFSEGSINAITRHDDFGRGKSTMEQRLKGERRRVLELNKDKEIKKDSLQWKKYTKETKIQDKVAFVSFENGNNDVNDYSENKTPFFINEISIPGKTASYYIGIGWNQDYTDKLYEKYPDIDKWGFSEEEVEKRMQAHIDIIDDLIISVDNF